MREQAVELIKQNHKAYFVGGVVRDHLLGVKYKDVDITTSATPDEVEQIFDNTIPTGKEFGTITVVVEKELYEVTTFRADGKYTDSRRPDQVKFSQTIEEDLSRRDLAINAIAMDIDGNIIDPFNGTKDLKHKIIRTVGRPQERFREDPLRMLRAIRFVSKLDFLMDAETFQAIKKLKHKIRLVSKERILKELEGILLGKGVKTALKLLIESELLKEIKDIKIHIGNIEKLPFSMSTRLAYLLKEEKQYKDFLESLPMMKILRKEVQSILQHLDKIDYQDPYISARKVVSAIGPKLTQKLLLIEERMTSKEIQRLMSRITRVPYKLEQLPIKGQNVERIFGVTGPKVGQILKELLEIQLESKKELTRKELIEIYKRGKHGQI